MTNSEIAISVEHISKEFRINKSSTYGRFSEVLQNTLLSSLKGKKNKTTGKKTSEEKFLALDDVSFEVKQGEILGIVGRNGAGKSTLLKILSRITPPSSGRFGIRGRIGSLLEVGTGFHPELTGRENIFLNGTIIGMKKREIEKHFDEIVAFAEVEKFIDTPVKHFSSGMYMRLAFSVAAHLDPEILIVDEVLAVGDAGFQKKCLEKMKLIGETGKTIIFVSHHLNVVRNLCKTAVWLDSGRMLGHGTAHDVVEKFQHAWNNDLKTIWQGSTLSFKGEIELVEVEIKHQDQSVQHNRLLIESELMIRIRYRLHNAENFHPSFLIYNSDDQILCGGSPVIGFDHEIDHIHGHTMSPATYEAVCNLQANLLQPGRYSLTVNFSRHDGELMMNQVGLLNFEMEEQGIRKRDLIGNWLGLVRPMMKWTTTEKQAFG